MNSPKPFIAFTQKPAMSEYSTDCLLVSRPEDMDGATCIHFWRHKIHGGVPDIDIIARYVGAKHLRYT